MKVVGMLLIYVCFLPTNIFSQQSEILLVDAHGVKLQILENDKPTNWSMVVDLMVIQDSGDLWAFWNSIFIKPSSPSPAIKTVLRADNYSSNDGSIHNIIVANDSVSFELNCPDRIVKIVCIKRGKGTYDISGKSFNRTGLHYGRSNTTTTETWRSVDKLTLPSLEVWGQGDQ